MDSFEIIDSRFRRFVLPNAPLEKLADGCRWLEGPVWFADMGCLLVSDIPNDRILGWTERGGVTVFRQPAGFPNGQTRDREGRLITCSHQKRCVLRSEYDGSVTVLAECFDGKRLNSPNDVVVKSDGTIWFSDPPYGIQTDYEGGKQDQELPARVYRLDPRNGALSVVSDDFEGPNGLCFSADERRLYIVETGLQFAEAPVRHIRVLDVDEAGDDIRGGRVFHTVRPGNADGIRCDEDGHVWSSAGDGVHCIDPSGALLGKIKVPFTVSNLAFGGRCRSRLFICASHTLFAIYTNQRGAQRP
ncbi:MAG: SMP-30/gluconolactonase/LRE family protein [Rhodospirillales bacterium]|nr:SMP-30/gluconolactonase/LRE family protein [Rhodospirillales bacterium]